MAFAVSAILTVVAAATPSILRLCAPNLARRA